MELLRRKLSTIQLLSLKEEIKREVLAELASEFEVKIVAKRPVALGFSTTAPKPNEVKTGRAISALKHAESISQNDFVTGCRKFYTERGYLTPRQMECLENQTADADFEEFGRFEYNYVGSSDNMP